MFFFLTIYYLDNTNIGIDKSEKIKNLIRDISICEEQHPQELHQELKNKLNYQSYKKLTHKQYRKALEILKEHPCYNRQLN